MLSDETWDEVAADAAWSRLPDLLAEMPAGGVALRRWKRARRRFEYDLFTRSDPAWLVVVYENRLLGVWG